ncbi:hypothetical protein MHYP_G00020170 [Metynnis hypsauchen]
MDMQSKHHHFQRMKNAGICHFLGVYHSQKPGQIRVVFNSSACHHDMPLNGVLLTGPDLNNSLLGVLIHFRKEKLTRPLDAEAGTDALDPTSLKSSQASNIIIKLVQAETCMEELAALADGKPVNKNSPLFKLNPKVDEGLIRIGGRLSNAQLESREKNPLILPKNHNVSTLLAGHFHKKSLWPFSVLTPPSVAVLPRAETAV